MKIRTVEYGGLFNLGNYENEKLSVVAQVEEGESLAAVVADLRDQVISLAQPEAQKMWERRQALNREINELEEKVKIARENWQKTAEFLRAQGIRPDVPDFPFIPGLLSLPASESVRGEFADEY